MSPRERLQHHRLAAVEVSQVSAHYPRTVGRNARLGSHGSAIQAPIVILHTDQGATGWGLAGGDPQAAHALVGYRLDNLIDPDIGIIDDTALSLDFALHDLVGQILGVGVYELLGNRGDSTVRCYDGAIYFDDLDPDDAPRGVAAALTNCAHDHALGFRDFKLKIGRGFGWMEPSAGLRRDIEVTHAVREAYPHARILVDANNGYSSADAIEYLDAVDGCELFWIEEPFHENKTDLRRLRERLPRGSDTTLIADGEYRPDEPFVLQLSEDGLVDVLLMDIVSYGLTAWRRLMPTLERLGVYASPHAWGMPLKTFYVAQLAAGLGNVVAIEGVPGDVEATDTSGYRLDNGVLRIPDAPGFGMPLPETTGDVFTVLGRT